jgi:hypothetical protein
MCVIAPRENMMEYQFFLDPTTGNASAKFSLEHEVIGPWLETELGKNPQQLQQILTTIEQVTTGKKSQALLAGHEYSLLIEPQDITVCHNSLLEPKTINLLVEDELELNDFDQAASCQCGTDDFKQLLAAWAQFVQ